MTDTQDFSEWRGLHQERASFGAQLAAARLIADERLREVAVRETWRQMQPEQIAGESFWIVSGVTVSPFTILGISTGNSTLWHKATGFAARVIITVERDFMENVANQWATFEVIGAEEGISEARWAEWIKIPEWRSPIARVRCIAHDKWAKSDPPDGGYDAVHKAARERMDISLTRYTLAVIRTQQMGVK